MSGTTDKITGNIKEAVGKVTGNSETEAEGRMDQAKGAAKAVADDAVRAAKGAAKSIEKETRN